MKSHNIRILEYLILGISVQSKLVAVCK